jgi:hypothetical protein
MGLSDFVFASIAKVAHEANRAYCASQGDLSQVPWEQAPDWQRLSAIDGVQAIHNKTVQKPEDSHANWMRRKAADGWTYGPVKSESEKTHPCMVPYEQLPAGQKVKDSLFFAIVTTLLKEYEQ